MTPTESTESMESTASTAQREARRRRGSTALLVLGACISLVGLVVLPMTGPVTDAGPFGDARLWALSLLISGVVFVAVGLVVRVTPAPAPLTQPRRSWLWASGLMLLWLVGQLLIDRDRDWMFYAWGGGLAALYLGIYLHERSFVRRRRADEAARSESGSGAAPSGSMDGPASDSQSTPPAA
ncbi:membrane associated rhomboid family serine protease [Agrococcus sp. UYP33]